MPSPGACRPGAPAAPTAGACSIRSSRDCAGIWREGGRSFITHNGFVGLERSRQIVEGLGFALRIVLTTLINISDDKLERMTKAVLAAQDGRSIHRYGPYAFAEMHIVEIAAPGTIGG